MLERLSRVVAPAVELVLIDAAAPLGTGAGAGASAGTGAGAGGVRCATLFCLHPQFP